MRRIGARLTGGALALTGPRVPALPAFRHWVAEGLTREAEQRRLFPWLAVAFGAGILVYFGAADGTPIPNAARLRNKLGLTPVGERVQLTVNRKGVVHDISVEVVPEGEKANTTRGSRPAQPRAAWNPRRLPQ